MNGEKYIGLDVHQATISVAVLDCSAKLVMESVLETRAATILHFLAGLRGSLHVTFEESTCAAWLYDLLRPHVSCLVVCNPRKNALLKAGNKSDRIDARKLAELLRGKSAAITASLRPGPWQDYYQALLTKAYAERGWISQQRSALPVEGEKCFLTSPFIKQALSPVTHPSWPSLALPCSKCGDTHFVAANIEAAPGACATLAGVIEEKDAGMILALAYSPQVSIGNKPREARRDRYRVVLRRFDAPVRTELESFAPLHQLATLRRAFHVLIRS